MSETLPGPVPTELVMLALAAVLLVVQLLVAAGARSMTFGLDWAAGPRDKRPGEPPLWGERADRAFRNLLETFPVFAAFAVGVVAAGVADATTALGSQIYVAARVAYLPAYLIHIPFVRSLIWVVSMVAIAMVGWPLLEKGLS